MTRFVLILKVRVRSSMNIACRFRIYPNAAQRIQLAKTFGCCRFIYNRMLADRIEEYQKNKKMLCTTPARYKKEFPWLKEVDSLALANVQLHLESAYKKFFREPKAGFPRFKSKHHGSTSYTTNLVNGNIKLGDGRIQLPKLKLVKIVVHREIPDHYILKSVTITQEPSGEYYASLLFYYESQVIEPHTGREQLLGIDFAMDGMAVFSDGTRAEYPMYYRQMQKKLAREQRKLSHCEKKSQNYKKQRRKVAKIHQKIKNQRRDFQHKRSTELVRTYGAICVEDLNLKGMSGGLHLGRGVMDNSYGSFLGMVSYKLERQGKRLVKVDRFFPSSKRCSRCGKIKPDLTLSDRIYLCECGNRLDRELNAAINIREEGKRLLCA